MLQNNPNFTSTVGTVRAQTASFSGMQETKLYTPAEKEQLQHARPTDHVVADIYNLPNNKILFQDLAQDAGTKEE